MKIKRKKVQIFIDVSSVANEDFPDVLCRALADVVAKAKDGATIDWTSLSVHRDGKTHVVVTDTTNTGEDKTLRLTVDVLTPS